MHRIITNGSINYVDGIYNEQVFVNKEAIRDIRQSLKFPHIELSDHVKKQFFREKTIKYINRVLTVNDFTSSKIKRDNHIVEYYTKNNNIYKYVIRISCTETTDLCVVISPKYDVNLIITAWVIDKNDKHGTLDKRRYVTKKQHINVNIK